MSGIVYTIGYGNRDADAIWSALRNAGIGVLLDVRSAPYSRHRPQFSKDPLSRAAVRHSIGYRFVGRALGGRPDDPSCYVDGKVDYALCRERRAFQDGIDQVVAMATGGQIACLVCAEEDPARCHRTLLITPALVKAGVDVRHLLPDGSWESHQDLVERTRSPQMTLFGGAS